MVNPFDLRGPDFLTFYSVLSIGVLMAIMLVRYAISFTPAIASLPKLSGYEIAYLTGGPRRVALVVTSSMLDKCLATIRKGTATFNLVGPATGVSDRLHLRLLNSGMKSIALNQVASVLDGDLKQLRRTLQSNGLVLSDSATALTRGVSWLLMLATLAVGVIKICVGVSRNRPVGILVVMCIALLVLSFLVTRPPLRTRAGAKALRQLQSEHPRPITVDSTFDPSLVALWGVVVLTSHPDFASLRTAYYPIGDSSGGASCGSGSSCGGGGSSCGGGSGCGGCGGGGH